MVHMKDMHLDYSIFHWKSSHSTLLVIIIFDDDDDDDYYNFFFSDVFSHVSFIFLDCELYKRPNCNFNQHLFFFFLKYLKSLRKCVSHQKNSQ